MVEVFVSHGVFGLLADVMDSLLALALGKLELNLGEHVLGFSVLAIDLEQLVQHGPARVNSWASSRRLASGRSSCTFSLLLNSAIAPGQIGGHFFGRRIAILDGLGQCPIHNRLQGGGQP